MAVRFEYFQGAVKGSPFYGRPRPLVEMMADFPDRRLQSVELPAGWLVQCGGGRLGVGSLGCRGGRFMCRRRLSVLWRRWRGPRGCVWRLGFRLSSCRRWLG